MPLLWPDILQEPLQGEGLPFYRTSLDDPPSICFPPSISGRWAHDNLQGLGETNDRSLLVRQKKKVLKDWAIVSKVFPQKSLTEYVYYWLIVNTRSFYYDLPSKAASQSRDDCMVLCPLIDYLNHADRGCTVAFDGNGFTVTSDRAYATGDELFVTYGPHSSDFLLVEYGFVPERNDFDSLPLDDLLRYRFSTSTKEFLESAGYLWKYTLSSEGACYRTQVAIRTQILERAAWIDFVAGRRSDNNKEKARAEAYLESNILQVYHEETRQILGKLKSTDHQMFLRPKQTLIRRWEQIQRLIGDALENEISGSTRQDIQ